MTARPQPAFRPARRLAVVVACGLLLVSAVGCGGRASRSEPRAGGADTPKARESRKLAEALAVDAVKGGAEAGALANPSLARRGYKMTILASADFPAPAAPAEPVPPKPPVPPQPPIPPLLTGKEPAPRPGPSRPGKVVIKERVASGVPHPTEAEAEEDALRQAQQKIEQKFLQLDPPLRYTPSLAVVKNEFVRREGRSVRSPTDEEKELLVQAGYGPDRLYVEFDVEVTDEQVRELRTQERVASGLRLLGLIAGVALAAFLFLRIDEWTKGYLTSWLAFVAVALAGGVAAAILLV